MYLIMSFIQLYHPSLSSPPPSPPLLPLLSSFPLIRYSQLIYLVLIGKHSNLPYLRRDTILVRFFHGFLSSAPHLTLHLYALLVSITSSSPTVIPLSPAVLSALGISAISVLYTTLTFAFNDRVSGKNRRVILPAHLSQALWYLCMLGSRVAALTVFAYAYSFYVVAVIGGHWVLSFLLLLIERTTFCADIERTANGELKFTRRLWLEIPFDFIAAGVYVFVYFNPKRGRTRYWAGAFHLLMLAENTTMSLLFFFAGGSLGVLFTSVSLGVGVGLYLLGLVFMFSYYCIYHPNKTENCFWVGIPRKCCAYCACSKTTKDEDGIVGIGYRNQTDGVTISGPTLVSHNGFVPKNLLPVGSRNSADGGVVLTNTTTTSAPQGQSTVSVHSNSSSRVVERGNGSLVSAATTEAKPRGQYDISGFGSRSSRAHQGANEGYSSSAGYGSRSDDGNVPFSPHSSNTTGRTASESNPAFSDCLASELTDDLSSNNVLETTIDTVIDTPLSGCSPQVMDTSILGRAGQSRLLSTIVDTESQKAFTDDTGIDVEPSDLQLTPGAFGGNSSSGFAIETHEQEQLQHAMLEGSDLRLPIFVDVLTKQQDYNSNSYQRRNFLESYYFPSSNGTSNTVTNTVTTRVDEVEAAHHSRDSVTPTLPTPPTCSPSPPPLSPTPPPLPPSSSSLNRRTRELSEGSEDVFHSQDDSLLHHQNTTASTTAAITGILKSSPQPKRAPRSPIGARSFQVSADSRVEPSTTQSGNSGGLERKPVAPRSPKGARRLLVQQEDAASSSTTTVTQTTSPSHYQHRRPAPCPPIPPKSVSQSDTTTGTKLGADHTTPRVTSAPSLPPASTSLHQRQETDGTLPVATGAQATSSTSLPPKSTSGLPPDDSTLTRGLSSLVPSMRADRALSSSPFVTRTTATNRNYSRPVSFDPSRPGRSSEKAVRGVSNLPRGTSNYKRMDMRQPRPQLRPKSEGLHYASSSSHHYLYPHQQQQQTPSSGHYHHHSVRPPSMERSPHVNMSSSNRRTEPASTEVQWKTGFNQPGSNDVGGPAPPPKANNSYYPSQEAPPTRSAFNRVAPLDRQSRSSQVLTSESSPRLSSSSNNHLSSRFSNGPNLAHKSPSSHYPKIPQGASLTNAPKMGCSPGPPSRPALASVSTSILSSTQLDGNIDEPLTDLQSSSSRTRTSESADTDGKSEVYDRLEGAEGLSTHTGVSKVTSNSVGGTTNRSSYVSTTLYAPTSSAHESVV